MNNYDQNLLLQEKVRRSQYFLALVYAKIDAIEGVVKQNFKEYQTSALGKPDGNNRNFIFSIEGEANKMVIRVEDRSSLGKEQDLQTHTSPAPDMKQIMIKERLDGLKPVLEASSSELKP